MARAAEPLTCSRPHNTRWRLRLQRFRSFLASSPAPYAAVGNFTLSGTTASGTVDSNEGGLIPNLEGPLTGSVVLSSTAPSTTLTFPQFGTLTFDVLRSMPRT